MRAESLRQANDLQRLREQHADAQRKLSINEAAEGSLRSQLRAAEASTHRLKDEAAKTKLLVAQTRSACANEVRKRDRQIDSLKKAVSEAGRARGERKAAGITTISITGDMGGELLGTGTPSGGTECDDYDLRMETNGFLAELARGLSNENETLLALVRRTASELREMSGFPDADRQDGHTTALAANCDELAAEMETILEHLRTILTNPSFVPLEEVVVRDDEIQRLRDGWTKMESRWKEAVHLIDGWRRRMTASGRSVNIEELKMGLRLSPVRVQDVEETSQGLGFPLSTLQEEDEDEEEEEIRTIQSPSPAESLHLVPAPEYIDPEDSDSESSVFEDVIDLHELDVEEPNVQILEQSMVMMPDVDSSPLAPAPELTILRDSDTAGNRRPNSGAARGRKKPSEYVTTIVEENTENLVQAAPAALPPSRTAKRTKAPQKQAQPASAQPASRTAPAVQENTRPPSAASQVSTASTDSMLPVKTAEPSPVPQPTVTRPTQSSSLKRRHQQQHESSPRPPPRPASRASAKSSQPRQRQTQTQTQTQ